MDKNLNNPLVSVQICTFNRAETISRAIQSALDQSYTNIEIIIMDDASTDDTEIVVSRFQDSRIKYFKNGTNLGIVKNRNASIEKSNGKYIAILDSDDFWNSNDKIAKQVDFLENNRGYAIVGTQANIVDINDKTIDKINVLKTNKTIKKWMLLRNNFINSSVLINKKVILDVGGYDNSLPLNEDYDLSLKIAQTHKVSNLPDFYTSYRTGNISSMNNVKLAAKKHLQLIKRYKNNYPNFWLALIKSYLRLLKS